MSIKFRIVSISVGLTLFLSTISVNGQLLEDTAVVKLVKEEIRYIYNLQFDSAHTFYERIAALYPQHPIVYLLRGLTTYWENYPVMHKSPSHLSFEDDMRECIRLSELNDDPAYEAEYLLADLSARGMLLTFYADNDLIMEVTPLTISTYKHLRHAFAFSSTCADLNYFTGVYDYYREAYPRIYPVYKSLAFLFPHGDTERGIKELQKAARSSLVLTAESYSMLTWIYLNFENKLSESIIYSRKLHEEYPDNGLFTTDYIKDLLLMKKYDEAESLIRNATDKSLNLYFQAELIILKGILQEKRYHNNKLAEEYYNSGINSISFYGKYGNEYAAYAYFGLSRISNENGQKHTRKIYRKEATKLADFKKINFDK